MQLRGNWIDWSNPQFVGLYEDDWRPLLSMIKDAADHPAGLGAVIREVDSVQIYRQNLPSSLRLRSRLQSPDAGRVEQGVRIALRLRAGLPWNRRLVSLRWSLRRGCRLPRAHPPFQKLFRDAEILGVHDVVTLIYR